MLIEYWWNKKQSGPLQPTKYKAWLSMNNLSILVPFDNKINDEGNKKQPYVDPPRSNNKLHVIGQKYNK